MSLRIGRIAYLNVAPYFHYLSKTGCNGEFIYGVPSELNALLAEGTIDVCPSSSFEYAMGADDYVLLPGHSISSVGPVHSVLLLTPVPLAELSGEDIIITGESSSSIRLLKVLLAEFCSISDVHFSVPDIPVEECLQNGQPALLIGDRALSAAACLRDDMQVIDLGALWYHFTGLPFVFALWIIREQVVVDNPEAIRMLDQQLQQSRQLAFSNLHEMAKALSVETSFTVSKLEGYWRGMSYDLTDGHLEGLKLYYYLCHKYDLLENMPEFRFFP